MITDLLTKRIQALSQWQTFLGVFTYKMAAKINWHKYATKLRHCHPMYDERILRGPGWRSVAISITNER